MIAPGVRHAISSAHDPPDFTIVAHTSRISPSSLCGQSAIPRAAAPPSPPLRILAGHVSSTQPALAALRHPRRRSESTPQSSPAVSSPATSPSIAVRQHPVRPIHSTMNSATVPGTYSFRHKYNVTPCASHGAGRLFGTSRQILRMLRFRLRLRANRVTRAMPGSACSPPTTLSGLRVQLQSSPFGSETLISGAATCVGPMMKFPIAAPAAEACPSGNSSPSHTPPYAGSRVGGVGLAATSERGACPLGKPMPSAHPIDNPSLQLQTGPNQIPQTAQLRLQCLPFAPPASARPCRDRVVVSLAAANRSDCVAP